MAQTTSAVAGKAQKLDAVRYTHPETGKVSDFLVEDSFPAKTESGITYMLVEVDTGKYRRNDLVDGGWTFA